MKTARWILLGMKPIFLKRPVALKHGAKTAINGPKTQKYNRWIPRDRKNCFIENPGVT